MPQIVWTAPPSGGRECHNHRWFEYSGQKSGSGNIRSAIHPDDLPRRDTLWERARSTGESYADEIRLRDASGNYRWHLKRVIPVKGAQGEIIRWIGNCTDIQEHKQFQETLQSLNRRLEFRVQERTAELMEANSRLAETSVYLTGILHTATQAAIFLVDNRGIVRIFNRGAENMLGYAAAEIVDTATVDLFWNSLDLCVQPGEDALDRSISAFREWNFVRKDGAQVPVALGITPMRDSGGKQIGLLGIAIDITERKVLERELHINNEQLREQTLRADMANRAKDQFLATMSHEIRTPLNAIMGIADLLRDSPLNAEQRNYVEIFRRAGSALLALINDLLDFSKIEAGQIELENLEFDVEELFEEVLELTAPKARAKALTLMLRTSPSLPSRVIGDPARIRQVLINLLGNAAKFTHSGEIVLSASVAGDPAGGSMEFSVSDTGIGIPADKTEAIFEDFRQADSTTSRNYGAPARVWGSAEGWWNGWEDG